MSGDAYAERTFIMVKPDGVQRGLVGKIIKRFEEKGFKLVAMKFMWVSSNLEHFTYTSVFICNSVSVGRLAQGAESISH